MRPSNLRRGTHGTRAARVVILRQEVIMTSRLTLVLVHGAWHGPWCWELLMEQLSGVEVRAVTLASSSSDPCQRSSPERPVNRWPADHAAMSLCWLDLR